MGQAHGGFAMGVGFALLETLPPYEGGPGNGQWNLGQYLVARGSDLPLRDLEIEMLPPLTPGHVLTYPDAPFASLDHVVVRDFRYRPSGTATTARVRVAAGLAASGFVYAGAVWGPPSWFAGGRLHRDDRCRSRNDL